MATLRKTLLSIDIRLEHDIVHVRQRARQIAQLLGFEAQDQTRIATAVSEIARNAYSYAQGGKAEFQLTVDGTSLLTIRVQDQGDGIADLKNILRGGYISSTGMGLGLLGAKRLMDGFEVITGAQGTAVILQKRLPPNAPRITDQSLAKIVTELATVRPQGHLEELQQQNRELLQALEALRARQEELAELNQELEDTNRGVVALYAELDEKADHLQRANEVKTRFLADMTHEFRTPLNSVLSLSRLLIDRVDGPLNEEQERQVALIRRAASTLSDLVNDLLDLAKVEAGKLSVKVAPFDIAELFGALRGMLRPLLAANSAVQLIFEDANEVGVLVSDEAKVSQVLRNFISNALKYTERGEVRVRAKRDSDDYIVLSVTDTGIGIDPADHALIFEEFAQIDSPLQKRAKGTGLGLPLARKLAQLLGGEVTVQSALGKGSTFSARIPRVHTGPAEAQLIPEAKIVSDFYVRTVLVVEDNDESLLFYQKSLTKAGFHVRAARDLKTAREIMAHKKPIAVVADIMLDGEDAWNFISELKADSDSKHIPIIVVTVLDTARRAYSLGASAFHLKPVPSEWLVEQVERLAVRIETVLLIDDDIAARYIARGLFAPERYRVVEADSAMDGLRLAREMQPAAIVLDVIMPDLDGLSVLQQLRAEPKTRNTPVILYTSKTLEPDELEKLRALDAVLLSKSDTADARARGTALIEDALALARACVRQ